ncbi:MAG: hypothetical protein EPO24_01355, partial [Bacteroidetes bacterium]
MKRYNMQEKLQQFILERAHFDSLLAALHQRGYRVIGPVVRDSAIAYDEVSSSDELPVGWTDEHGAGVYRLIRNNDHALFGYVVGPYSWKKILFPPVLKLLSAQREKQSFHLTTTEENDNPSQLPSSHSPLTKYA